MQSRLVRPPRSFLASRMILALALATSAPAAAQSGEEAGEVEAYAETTRAVQARRDEQGARELLERDPAALEREMVERMEQLFEHWYGTTWGLGAPQTKTPGQGKINCGMFVGRTLVDAGFELDHVKLQRQPAELIIKSLAPRAAIERWRNAPMKDFIGGVQQMGPGLYIIGLDFHVGYLLVRPDREVRFIHASYVTHIVLDEPAAEAVPIVTSKYRVVGKILQPDMLEHWVEGERIRVLGDW